MDVKFEEQQAVLEQTDREVREFLSYVKQRLGNHVKNCSDLERVLGDYQGIDRSSIKLSETYPLFDEKGRILPEDKRFVVFVFSRDNYYAYFNLNDVSKYLKDKSQKEAP